MGTIHQDLFSFANEKNSRINLPKYFKNLIRHSRFPRRRLAPQISMAVSAGIRFMGALSF
jgi:hypothetical protein